MWVPAWGCEGWSGLEGAGSTPSDFSETMMGDPASCRHWRNLSLLNRAHYQRRPAFGNQLLDYLSVLSVPTEIHLHSCHHILRGLSTYVYVLSITYLLWVLNVWHSSWPGMVPHEWSTRKGKLGAGNFGNACKWVGSFQEAWLPQRARTIRQRIVIEWDW